MKKRRKWEDDEEGSEYKEGSDDKDEGSYYYPTGFDLSKSLQNTVN